MFKCQNVLKMKDLIGNTNLNRKTKCSIVEQICNAQNFGVPQDAFSNRNVGVILQSKYKDWFDNLTKDINGNKLNMKFLLKKQPKNRQILKMPKIC